MRGCHENAKPKRPLAAVPNVPLDLSPILADRLECGAIRPGMHLPDGAVGV